MSLVSGTVQANAADEPQSYDSAERRASSGSLVRRGWKQLAEQFALARLIEGRRRRKHPLIMSAGRCEIAHEFGGASGAAVGGRPIERALPIAIHR